jgi:hypothetical protein
MPKRILGAAAIAATTAFLVVPSVASARAGDHTFQQTYPVASHLCTEVAAGKRHRLKAVAATVLEDCATLETGFKTAQTTVLAVRASTGAQIAADQALTKAACPLPTTGTPACVTARHTEAAAIKVLRQQRVAAAHLYYNTIETNRRTFWSAVRKLRGLSHIKGDARIHLHDN